MKIGVLILAAGRGERFGEDKSLFNYYGKPLIVHSLEIYSQMLSVDNIVIVANENNIESLQIIAKQYIKVSVVLLGGNTRFASTLKGFEALKLADEDLVIFHNVANPAVTREEINDCLQAAQKYGASGVAHLSVSTVRFEKRVLPRERVYLMETPQALQAGIFKSGSKLAIKQGIVPTDDLMLAELAGVTPRILTANVRNKKITFQEDVNYLTDKIFYGLRALENDLLRVGFGHDSHRFTNSGICRLGGLDFSDTPKLEANSDGDVALHALTNAILSVLGEGSLAVFADEMCRQGIINSAEYLKVALNKLHDRKAKIINCSLSFEGARPRLENHFTKMRKVLAELLNISIDRVGLTATSGEGLTAFGRGEGMQVFALVQIIFSSDQ